MFEQVFCKGLAYIRLGVLNILAVFFYRLALRFHVFYRKHPVAESQIHSDALFSDSVPRRRGRVNALSSPIIKQADALLEGRLCYFSCRSIFIGSPPDWFYNPIQEKKFASRRKHWSLLSDFNNDVGDIKCIWEPSRFDWLIVLVQAFELTGESRYLSCANAWAVDWCRNNPPNAGPNWKCGQEVAIRMMQVLLTSFLLEQHTQPTDALIRFIVDHAERITPTLYYAIAQDNNHGTSEAAALFIAGSWLLTLDSEQVDAKQARRWRKKGRKWLENRMARLVEPDGSFSQYSVNYHRVLLDTVCYVEFWRDLLQEPPFTDRFYQKAKAATQWLFTLTDEQSGDVPNIGANDGARLFNLSPVDYRDYRPSVQLAARLFMQRPAYSPGVCDETLEWLGLRFSETDYLSLAMEKKSTLFKDGGYCYLNRDGIGVYVRYPVFRFRPGHADALHVDLWYDGANIIRDAGTYSYNTDSQWMSYFPGTRSHSTVEFDGRDQMVRVSRFLFGNWLQVNHVSSIETTEKGEVWSVGYRDNKGAEHRRELLVCRDRVIVKDYVKGFRKKAVVRWRLIPAEWTLETGTCSSAIATISMSSSCPSLSMELVTEYESRYYFTKTSLPVLTAVVHEACEVTTEIKLHQSVH